MEIQSEPLPLTNLGVLDLFCGAGGFSEGFRQQGFDIVFGADSWGAAKDTFNFNFRLKSPRIDLLKISWTPESISQLPDTEVIIGSPPCVSFSSSNRSGKSDKSVGVQLIEAFFRIVTVKKYQNGSKLEAWVMENVSNSKYHIKPFYSFRDLNLSDWARSLAIEPDMIAIELSDNACLLNAAEYGCPQLRKRLFIGEIIRTGQMPIPKKSHGFHAAKPFKTLGEVRHSLPKPNKLIPNAMVTDPLYPKIKIPSILLTDHFYDTGIYKTEWKNSEYLKVNHPYMGRMSFPEDEGRPSRTITATRIVSSRESLLLKSECNRSGDGEYRTPTIREAATLTGFPLTFQFLSSEGGKWRLVGNAVSPCVSSAIAATIRHELGLAEIHDISIVLRSDISNVVNLNSLSPRSFDSPPLRQPGSRFRRHLFKDGNITITLANYDIRRNTASTGKWNASIQYGNGIGFPCRRFRDGTYAKVEASIRKLKHGNDFVEFVTNGFSEKIASSRELQLLYERRVPNKRFLDPLDLIEVVANRISTYEIDGALVEPPAGLFTKTLVPTKQLFALFALSFIATKINDPDHGKGSPNEIS